MKFHEADKALQDRIRVLATYHEKTVKEVFAAWQGYRTRCEFLKLVPSFIEFEHRYANALEGGA